MSFGEPVKYDIVDSFSEKYHIFWSKRKIRKCRKDFLIDSSENDRLRVLDGFFSDVTHRLIGHDPPDKYPENYSDNYPDNNAKKWIHIKKFLIFYFSLIIERLY